MRTKRVICVLLWAMFFSITCTGCQTFKRAAARYAGQPIQDRTKVPQYPVPVRPTR